MAICKSCLLFAHIHAHTHIRLCVCVCGGGTYAPHVPSAEAVPSILTLQGGLVCSAHIAIRGFWSVAGKSTCLTSACALHTSADSAASSAHTDVAGVCVVLRSDAYRHSEGTQCPNCRGIRSVTGKSACLASASALHTRTGSGVSSAHTALRCASGVWGA